MDIAIVVNDVVDIVYRKTTIDKVPNIPGTQRIEVPENTVFGGYILSGDTFLPPEKSLSELKVGKILEVNAIVAEKLSEGAPISSNDQIVHIELSDSSRADMSGMATTALAAASGAASWPESYQLGWITKENIRIPLASPSDGLSLASYVGNYYALVKQNGRSLKDSIINSETKDELSGIDINEGWPEVVLEI